MTGHQRFIVIMTIVLGLMALAAFTALGKVEEKTSYGLTGILLILGQVIAAVFKNEKGTPEESEPKEPQ